MAPNPVPIRTVTGVTMIKKFQYRDTTDEEFSNKYFFKTPVPNTPQEWTALVDSVRDVERPIFSDNVTFVRAYGYNTNDPKAHHVFAVDWEALGNTEIGTFTPTTGVRCAGDQAALVEWRTARLSKNGKPVYLRKFLHQPWINPNAHDELAPEYMAALTAYWQNIDNTPIGGGITSGGYDDTIVGVTVSKWITMRQLKRRGKRPLAHSSATTSATDAPTP